MRHGICMLCAALVVALPATSLANDGPPRPRVERVKFAAGTTSASIKGTLKGDAVVDYVVRASAGQTLAVALKPSNPQNYVNVLPPGSDEAMFVGSNGGDFKAMLPADGDYRLRVYLMRPAARRNESSRYTLDVAVTGAALAALPGSRDAKVGGTPYHATAKVPCTLPYVAGPQQCDASVIRRGTDGTATVVFAGGPQRRRQVLFAQGKPVASDSQDPLTFSREGDLVVVKVGADERYEFRDALLTGG